MNNFSRVTDKEVKQIIESVYRDMNPHIQEKNQRKDLLAFIFGVILIELGCAYGILRILGVL